MNKELIDSAWRILPAEFKEEVKRKWEDTLPNSPAEEKLEKLFGRHNLTSDAEGEDEMLYVSCKRVQEMYKNNCDEIRRENISSSDKDCYEYANEVLKTLFGSKCLPDNVESSEPNVESLPQNPTENCDNKSHISADCNKPAEPKFTKGDMVHCKSFGYEGDYKVLEYTGGPRNCYDCIDKYGAYYRFYESDLEPYTEPTDFGKEVNFSTKKQSRNLSQESANCDKEFDNILKNGFREHNRLHIAAMMMQGLLANPNNNANLSETVVDALNCADALIAEVEKGNSDGED